jgi:hypothetical protein
MRRLIYPARSWQLAVALSLAGLVTFAASPAAKLTRGKAQLQSASQLAFGPDGILFIGDSLGGSLFAIDTADVKPPAGPVNIQIPGLNTQIAAVVGTRPDEILINDIKVNPISKNVYLAVSRGRGPDGIPVILRVNAAGQISEMPLDKVKFSMVALPDSPEAKPYAPPVRSPEGPKNGNPRGETITDMSYVDGRVIIAGLSNEEFSSDLRSIPFPFQGAEKGASIEIWHSSHGRYETQAPIRTFIPYTIDNQKYILASYTCTPLVKIPVSALKPGAKVLGTTISELGNSNRPLEMISYRKEGHEYILMANSSRGVMKLAVDNIGTYKAITPPTAACQDSREPAVSVQAGSKTCGRDIEGVPFQTLAAGSKPVVSPSPVALPAFDGVWQLAKLDDSHVLVLSDSKGKLSLIPGNASSFTAEPGGSLDLKTIELP